MELIKRINEAQTPKKIKRRKEILVESKLIADGINIYFGLFQY